MYAKILAGMAAASLGSAAAAQGSGIIYAPGRTIADQGISLRSWGSGTIAETDETAFEGTTSIRVSTRNLFQGGIITFATPVDLGARFSDRNNLLRLMFRLADQSLTIGGAGGGGGSATVGGAAGVGAGTGGTGGGGGNADTGGGSPAGGGRGAGGGGAAASTALPLNRMRFIFTTTDGKKSEAYVRVATSGAGERGWKSAAIPLQSITGFDRTNKIVKEIAVAGDSTSTIYLGDLRVVNDTTPIRGDVNHSTLNLALGDEVEFIGRGMGGSSVLRYTWDFNASDGIQVDAEGQVIKRKFRKPGTFTITLTISDAYGLKAPYTTTVTAKVNP